MDETRSEIARLSELGHIEYARERQSAAKRLGVNLGALDAAVDEARAKQRKNDGETTTAFLSDPVPWPEPVEGEQLITEICSIIKRHMVLSEHASIAIALHVVFTHCHDAAVHSPILTVESPEKRCGKTTLASLLAQLAAKPLLASNISTAAVFRTIEKYRPTLIIDEGDTFLRDNDEMRGILNSGHNRSAAYVLRCEGDDHEPRVFSTWCPKAIFIIGSPPDTLRDRSVIIRLRRKHRGETVVRFRADRTEVFAEMQSKAARWALDHLAKLRAADPQIPTALNDRAADNWRILLVIADEAGGDWPRLAREAAQALSGDGIVDDEAVSAGALILRDTRAIFAARGVSAIGSAELIKALCELPEAPWAEWRHGKPITGRGLAILLRSFEIRPRHSRTGSTYERQSFEDAWQRYLDDDGSASSSSLALPAASVTSLTNEKNENHFIELSDAHQSSRKPHGLNGVTHRKTAESPMFAGLVTHVTLGDGISEEGNDEIEEGRI